MVYVEKVRGHVRSVKCSNPKVSQISTNLSLLEPFTELQYMYVCV